MRPGDILWARALAVATLVVSLVPADLAMASQQKQLPSRLLLQINGTVVVDQNCDGNAPMGNASGEENKCQTAGEQVSQKVEQSSTSHSMEGDGNRKKTLISISAVFGVFGIVGFGTLVFGFVYYKKDPERFRRKYGKMLGVASQQGPTIDQPTFPYGHAGMHPPQSRHAIFNSVGPLSGPAIAPPPIAASQGQHQPHARGLHHHDLDASAHSSHSAISVTAPAQLSNTDASVSQPVPITNSGFNLVSNLPQVVDPQQVPAPGLSLQDNFPPSTTSGGPACSPQGNQYPYQFPHRGEQGLSYCHNTMTNFQMSNRIELQSNPVTVGPPKRWITTRNGGVHPPTSPFFPPGSQLSSERRSSTPRLETDEDPGATDTSEPSADPTNLLGAPENEFPKLDYDIRVLPLSERPTPLGTGAFGTVEAGVFTDSNGEVVHVAVKYGTGLPATMCTREVLSIFQSELNVLSKVPLHANIVHCYGGRVQFADEDQIGRRDVYIVEELMHTNLHDVIYGDDFTEGLPYRLILDIALHIATGLQHLHKAGVLHYDLKPGNILVDEDFNAKIADFGASKVKYKTYITGTAMRGTLGYMAPELLLGAYVKNLQISDKIDIYSFGVMLWEMVERDNPPNILSLGNQPYDQERAPLVEEHRFPFTRCCPEGLRSLINCCVSLNPKDRPSAGEIRESVEAMILQSQNRMSPLPSVDG